MKEESLLMFDIVVKYTMTSYMVLDYRKRSALGL